jgi:orotidine-5'-phosphate decarboxylase
MNNNQLPKIFVALDFSDEDTAKTFINKLSPNLCGLKVGKELFTSSGPSLIKWIHEKGFCTFLDLKFHDIPTTVKKACRAAADLGVSILNVHALGGSKMMDAAREGVNESDNNPLLVAVTILTSHDEDSLRDIGIQGNLQQTINKLAIDAARAKLDGIVCSAQDIPLVKDTLPDNFIFITPGIRLNDEKDDQKRIMTPNDAIKNGASFLVIGRPVTLSDDPVKTLIKINDEINF